MEECTRIADGFFRTSPIGEAAAILLAKSSPELNANLTAKTIAEPAAVPTEQPAAPTTTGVRAKKEPAGFRRGSDCIACGQKFEISEKELADKQLDKLAEGEWRMCDCGISAVSRDAKDDDAKDDAVSRDAHGKKNRV